MGHGFEDLGGRAAKHIVHALFDLGELAVRLGSPNMYDRLGDVLFQDSFEYGLVRWLTAPEGDNSYVKISGIYAKTGSWSAALQCGTLAGDYAQINCSLPFPYNCKYGFEFSFALWQRINVIWINVAVGDGAYSSNYRISYYPITDYVYYRNNAGVNVEVDNGFNMYHTYQNWQTIKMVVDLTKNTYDRLRVNDNVYDLSGIGTYRYAAVSEKMISVSIRIEPQAGFQEPAYIDDVIVTFNEP
jgi:hypothetical protein